MEKTLNCIVKTCKNKAIFWNGFLLKSRDKVIAGFCEEHKNTECINAFKITNCFGIYDKTYDIPYQISIYKIELDKIISTFKKLTNSDSEVYCCAEYCINKLIESHKAYAGKENDYKFWNQVKEELEKL